MSTTPKKLAERFQECTKDDNFIGILICGNVKTGKIETRGCATAKQSAQLIMTAMAEFTKYFYNIGDEELLDWQNNCIAEMAQSLANSKD